MTAAAEPAAAAPAAAAQRLRRRRKRPAASGPQIIHVQTEEGAGPPKAAIVIHDPSTIGQNLKIAHIPDRALIEASDTGPLPIRAADGRRPFDVYARPWSGSRGARVAIVIGGLAVSQTGTQAAIAKLPAEVTLAFAPQGNSIGRWMQAARQSGHEVVMQVPLEPFDYPNVNPGRNTLTVAASPDENLKNLRWALSRTTNYTGVMNYMGARFSADAAAMGPFMAELGKRGLAYIDDGSSARSLAPDLRLEGRRAVRRRRHGDRCRAGPRRHPEKARRAGSDRARQRLRRRHRLGLRPHRRYRGVLGDRGEEARHRDRADLGGGHRSGKE